MSRTPMPCQKQDVLSLLTIAVERLDKFEGAKEITETLQMFADECNGKERRILKKFAKAINEVYGGSK